MYPIIIKWAHELRPKDCLEAIGPLSLTALFGFVLYAITSNKVAVVEMNMGLLFWPLYQFIGFLAENGLMNLLLARKTTKQDDYIMAIAPLLLLIGLMSFFNYSHWVLLVVAIQLLPLLFHPIDTWDQKKGCLDALLKTLLLCIVFMLVLFGLQETLSKPYPLPYAEGGFKFLPGMMIIGIGYYSLSAILNVLMQPFMRSGAMN